MLTPDADRQVRIGYTGNNARMRANPFNRAAAPMTGAQEEDRWKT